MPLRKNGSSMPFASSSNARRPSARARFVSTEPNSMNRKAMLMPCMVALMNTPATHSPSPIIEPFSIVPPGVEPSPESVLSSSTTAR
jgi:hypothetical protein